MLRVALRGLAGRKLRTTLTAIAIVLGVAMVSGTYVLTDSINSAFTQIFTDSYAGTDAVVSGKSDISYQGDTAQAPSIPDSLLTKVRALPGTAVATGIVSDETSAKIIDRKGKAIDTGGAPAFGFGIDTAPQYARFNPLKLLEGRWPRTPDEVVIDESTAGDQHFRVGDRVGVASLKPVKRFRLVGVARYGNVSSLGGATFAVFTIPTAQNLFDRRAAYDAISVAAKSGTTPAQLVRQIRPILPATAQVRTGQEEAKKQTDDVAGFTSFIRYFLLAFAGIALFVGAFVIFNTLSMTVAQRTREFATLRTIGASRRQVLRSVLAEGLVVGTLASLAGLILGLLIARGIKALFDLLGGGVPTSGLVLHPRTVIVSLLVGILVTLAATLAPAIRATKVPPIAAVREGAVLPRGRLAPFVPYIAVVLTVIALAMLGFSLFASSNTIDTGPRLLLMALGVLLLFVGVAMISPRLVRPIAAIVGLPAKRIGGTAGQLAQRNSLRNPGRTAATAAALMIGLALVTFVGTLANGMKKSNTGAISKQVKADYVLTSQDGYTPFVAAAGDAIAKASVAAVATPVRYDLAKVDGSSRYLSGIDPAQISRVYHFDWKTGSDATLGQLGRDGAIVDKSFASDKHLHVGDTLHILAPGGRTATAVVKGIYKPPAFSPLLGAVSLTIPAFDKLYQRPRDEFTFVNVAGGSNVVAQAQLEQAVKAFPDAKVQSRSAWIESQNKDFNNFLTMLYVLLTLSVIVSLFGMVNTLALSVFERTREVGMLRAVGMTRRQVRRMIRHESVITALIGAALGLPLGIFLAALVTRALSQFDVQFAVPVPLLLVFTFIAVLAGLGAAILPARRAARLNVLEALQYE